MTYFVTLDMIFDKKDSSNLAENHFIKLPAPKNMGLDTKSVKKAHLRAKLWIFIIIEKFPDILLL